MKFKLENPQHQITAIRSVVEVFRGMEKNTYDNAHNEDIHSNVCSLTSQELADNIKRVIEENNIPDPYHTSQLGMMLVLRWKRVQVKPSHTFRQHTS